MERSSNPREMLGVSIFLLRDWYQNDAKFIYWR